MPRTLEAGLITQSESDFFRYVLMADIELDSGTVYVHNGVGTLTYNSNDYIGLGDFGFIDPIQEGAEISPYPINIGLSGIQDEVKQSGIDFFDAITTEKFYSRAFSLYIAAIDGSNDFVATPNRFWSGEMQSPSISVGRNNAVNVPVESDLAIFDKANDSRYSDADLQEEYPGDLGFVFLETLGNKSIVWRGRVGVAGDAPDRGPHPRYYRK